jgi:hypothetical protein
MKKSDNEIIMIGRCMVAGCKHTVRKTLYEIKNAPEQWNDFRCLEHDKHPLKFRELKATLNADHVCDSRCTNARGHNCECSCGGANHGLMFAI